MTTASSIEGAQRMGIRSLQLASACLAVVVLVMTVSLVMMISLTRATENEAQTLRVELACRAELNTAQEIANSEMQATIGEAWLFHTLDEDVPPEIVSRIVKDIATLRDANVDRLYAGEICNASED